MALTIVRLARWLAWQVAEPAGTVAELTPASITVFSSSR